MSAPFTRYPAPHAARKTRFSESTTLGNAMETKPECQKRSHMNMDNDTPAKKQRLGGEKKNTGMREFQLSQPYNKKAGARIWGVYKGYSDESHEEVSILYKLVYSYKEADDMTRNTAGGAANIQKGATGYTRNTRQNYNYIMMKFNEDADKKAAAAAGEC